MKNLKLKKPLDVTTTDLSGSVFLAGPCPRSNYHEDWRFEAYQILEELGFKGTVITPTNDQYMEMRKTYGDNMLAKQTEWERKMMHMCSALVFWVPRCEKWPAFTTNIEFGEWYKKHGVYFGFPKDATRMEYLTIKFSEQKKSCYNDLRTMLRDVVNDLQSSKHKKWFTGDTHFGQERTLQFSCRPFVDVVEMDLTMISNWNKNVRPNDIVYHAGDFADYSDMEYLRNLLEQLNFRELHWVFGNYDRKFQKEIKEIVENFNTTHDGDRKIIIYDQVQSNNCVVKLDDKEFMVIHEPYDFPVPHAETYLYGHIHGRSFAKRNGFDLGTDYHQFTPISEEQVLWFKNAMQYWDENVYIDRVLVK